MKFGTPLSPLVIIWTLSVVELKTVCAREISLFEISYTTNAERRNVSPSTGMPPCAGAMPNKHASSPFWKVMGWPKLFVPAERKSSLYGTLMVAPEKV